MENTTIAITCCTKKTCKRRIISETVTRTCPVCGCPTKKDKKFVGYVLEIKDEGYVILKEKGNKLNDSNRRKTAKSKKRTIYGKPISATRFGM